MLKGRSPAAGAMLLAAALAISGCTDDVRATPKIQSTVRPGIAPTPPAKGAYFGAWVDPQSTPAPASRPSGSPSVRPSGSPSGSAALPPGKVSDKGRVAAVGRFEHDLGRQLDITVTYRSWKQPFPQEADTALLGGGRYLLLNWSGTDTREIAAGKHDRYIQERARAVRALGKPIFLRWQRNMDKSSIRDSKIHSSADFIAAWKHLREIFRREKADNVAWVWSPSVKGFSGGESAAFYPGDDQVDWIGTDVYPGGNYDYRDFSEAAHAFVKWVGGRPKPVMISEFGVPRSYARRRAEWLRKTTQYLQDPQIKAVVYYDSDDGGTDEAGEPRYEFSTAGDKAAFSGLRELATTPYFNPRNLPVTPGG